LSAFDTQALHRVLHIPWREKHEMIWSFSFAQVIDPGHTGRYSKNSAQRYEVLVTSLQRLVRAPIQKPRCIVRYFRSPVSPKYNDILAISLVFLYPEAIIISSFCCTEMTMEISLRQNLWPCKIKKDVFQRPLHPVPHDIRFGQTSRTR
jgi:hypothetical protein